MLKKWENKQLKVAVIVSTFPKISETFILNQITGLVRRGHEVTIFSRFRPTESVVHPEVQEYDLLEKTVYFPSIPDRKWACRLKAAGCILLSFFCAPDVVIRTLRYLLGRGAPFSYPVLFSALTVLRFRPDVIHVHYGHNGNLFLPLKQIEPSAAFLTMFHGHDLLLGLEGGKDYYTRLFAEADLILANSEFTRDRLLEQGADAVKIRVHYVGIEVKKFPCRKELPHPDREDFRILTVARLCEQKGLDCSLQAVHHLIQMFPSFPIEYRIAGDGPLANSLKQLAQEWGVSEQVSFLGSLEQTEVIRHLREADAFLLTSIHEWLGMVLLEAQAVGVPVVAVRIGGIPEAVDPGRSAILVPPRDPQATAAALARLLKNPDQRLRMGQAGRQHVEKHFDIDGLNDKLEQIYRELCRK